MQALKDAKRRIVQQAAENLGKAERVARDEEAMKEALENFKAFEHELKTLAEQLKLAQAATAKWTERNLGFAEEMSKFFSTDSSPLRESSLLMASSAQRAHEVVQRSAAKVVENRGVLVLEDLLGEKIPALKKKIAEHANLETDVSSYTRRYKTAAEKKPPTDPEVAKMKEKLDRASAQYERVHDELLDDLRRLHREKHQLVRPVFVAVLAAQGELQKVLSQELSQAMETITGSDVDAVREEIKYLVESGGPPSGPPTKGMSGLPSMKSLFNKPSPAAVQSAKANKSSPQTSDRKTIASPRGASTPLNFSSNNSSSAFTVPSSSGRSTPPPVPTVTFEPAEESSEPVKSYDNVSSDTLIPGAVSVAIYDYDGPDPGDLSFKSDDRIRIDKEVSPGWWIGTREADGVQGLFPETYVKRIE